MKQRAEITYEKEETLVFRFGGQNISMDCEQCGLGGGMAPPSIVAAATGISEREIFRLIDSGSLQCVENGRVLVCPNCFEKARKEI